MFKQLSEYISKKIQAKCSFLGQLLSHSEVAAAFGGRSHAPVCKPGRLIADPSQGHACELTSGGCLRQQQPSGIQAPCRECGKRHSWKFCKAFLDMTPQTRWITVSCCGLYFNCQGSHFARNCISRGHCQSCGGKHHTLIYQLSRESGQRQSHPPRLGDGQVQGVAQTENPDNGAQQDSVEIVCASSGVSDAREAPSVRLKVVPVKICGARSKRVVEPYAFLDEGSISMLCTYEVAKSTWFIWNQSEVLSYNDKRYGI